MINIKAFANGTFAYVVWDSEVKIDNCLGFALYRKRNGNVELVDNYVGFEGRTGMGDVMHKPSNVWPIQNFMWCDYMLKTNDKVWYQVVAMGGTEDNLQPIKDYTSDWSDEVAIDAPDTGDCRITCYFNMGIVMSQYVSHLYPGKTGSQIVELLKADMNTVGSTARNSLSGQLRIEFLGLLNSALQNGGQIYAAIFELNDPEIIPILLKFKSNAHIVLANGAYGNGTTDENSAVRKQLKDAGADVCDRMLSGGSLGHNKFVVIADKDGNPKKVWTGSTNWTTTGLCTQANNGILLDNEEIAAIFKNQWAALVKATESSTKGYTEELVHSDEIVKTVTVGDGKDVSVWFSPVNEKCMHPGSKAQYLMPDLDCANQYIKGAKEGVLFLMFQPGKDGTLLNTIAELVNKRTDLYIRGVINADEPCIHDMEGKAVVLPDGIEKGFAYWDNEVTRQEFNAIGYAIIHSKVIVIDPFGDKPVVMTGSHNMGPKASSVNDENLLIIENCPELAAAYAINIKSYYDHYKWRYNNYEQQKAGKEWSGLEDNDSWQDGHFEGEDLKETRFWLSK